MDCTDPTELASEHHSMKEKYSYNIENKNSSGVSLYYNIIHYLYVLQIHSITKKEMNKAKKRRKTNPEANPKYTEKKYTAV